MRESFRLGRIGGVDVGAHWSVLVIVALIAWSLAGFTLPETAPGQPVAVYWIAGILTSLAFFGSILAHELSHAVVARRNGIDVEGITLWMLGGMARLTSHAKDANAELRIALAGPGMSVLIAVVAFVATGVAAAANAPEVLRVGLAWLAVINGILAVFNLIPGAPLDGGRVLAALIWRRTGDERGARVKAARAGRFIGQFLVAFGLVGFFFGMGFGGLWLAFIGWFVSAAARAEETDTGVRWVLQGVRVRDVMTPDPVTVAAGASVADFVAREAMSRSWSSYPVMGGDGSFLGLVTLRRIRSLPPESWAVTPLGQAAIPAGDIAVVAPDDLLLDALPRAQEADGRLVVLDRGRLVGIVSPSDISKALERYALVRNAPSSFGDHSPLSHGR
jgi:Zn-dependent protease/CBS domain-containing protein